MIGPGSEREASAIRYFHFERFKIKEEDVDVAGISIFGSKSRFDFYNLSVGDKDSGDLTKRENWINSLFNPNYEKSYLKYDLIWIRNPELEYKDKWNRILNFGSEFLTKDGIFCMVIRKEDNQHVEDFLKEVFKSIKYHLALDIQLDFANEEKNYGTHKRLLVFKLK